MATSPRKNDSGALFYTDENGEKHDAAIHEAILAEGEDDLEASFELALELGLTRDEALALFPDAGKR